MSYNNKKIILWAQHKSETIYSLCFLFHQHLLDYFPIDFLIISIINDEVNIVSCLKSLT